MKSSLIGITQQPSMLLVDGSYLKYTPITYARPFVPDPDTADVSKCESVALSGAEYLRLSQASSGSAGTVQTPTPQNWLELGNMSIADAQAISGYIGLLWAGVWGIKQVIKSLSFTEGNQDE